MKESLTKREKKMKKKMRKYETFLNSGSLTNFNINGRIIQGWFIPMQEIKPVSHWMEDKIFPSYVIKKNDSLAGVRGNG